MKIQESLTLDLKICWAPVLLMEDFGEPIIFSLILGIFWIFAVSFLSHLG